MKILRRVDRGSKEVIANVKLIKKNPKSVIVRLSNGDVIKRKNNDVVEW